jgi:hypothetical protein
VEYKGRERYRKRDRERKKESTFLSYATGLDLE